MREMELREFRRLLARRREELKQVIAGTEERIRDQLVPDDSGDSQIDFNHPADMVKGDPDYEKELHLVNLQRTELSLVDQALHRIEVDSYGVCEQCGSEMAMARLRAVPYARFCISCQEITEAARAY